MSQSTHASIHSLWWARQVCQYGLARALLGLTATTLALVGLVWVVLALVWPSHEFEILVGGLVVSFLVAFAMHVHRLQKEKIEQFGRAWWIQKQKERLRAYAKQVLWWGVTVWMVAWLLVLMFLYVEDESVREAKSAPPPLVKEVTQTNLQPLEVRTKDGQTIVIPPNATWSSKHVETVREKPKEEVKVPYTLMEKALMGVFFAGGGVLVFLSLLSLAFRSAKWVLAMREEVQYQVRTREKNIRAKHQASVDAMRLKERHASTLSKAPLDDIQAL